MLRRRSNSESIEKEVPEHNDENRPRQRRQKRLSPAFIFSVVLSVIVTISVALALSPLMAINGVNVTSGPVISEKKALDMAGRPLGQNFFVFDRKDAIASLESHPYVEKAEIHRRLPHQIEIIIKERQPIGILLNRGFYLQFSGDGLLLDNTRSLEKTNLPIITGMSLEKVPAPGQAIEDETFMQALAIVNAMPDDLLNVIQELNIAEADDILAYTSSGVEVRIGHAKHIKSRLQALDDIMKQIVITKLLPGDIEYIDIRFRRAPVVKLKGIDNIEELKDNKDGAEPSAASEAQSVRGTTEAETGVAEANGAGAVAADSGNGNTQLNEPTNTEMAQ